MMAWLKALNRPAKYKMGSLILLGILTGAGGLGLFNGFMAFSNTEKFCLSCHEMQPLYDEYTHSAHAGNGSGVLAVCADCHVPKGWLPKLIRKIHASKEIYYHFKGSIATPAKLEEKRLVLAERVWSEMRGNDSRECRSCHRMEGMVASKQNSRAQAGHKRALANGETCIDCHKGIAHQKPKLKPALEAAHQAMLEHRTQPSVDQHVAALGTLKMYGEKQGGKAQAVVLVGTVMKVAKREDARVALTLEGWRKAGKSRQIYLAPDRPQLLASTTKAGSKKIEPLSTTQTLSGVLWTKVRLTLWGSPEKLSDKPQAIWTYAARLNDLVCGQCHQPYAPDKYRVKQWPAQLKAMKPMAKLDKEDERLLQVWLQRNAIPEK
ncbi:NapC/NirT family cytochrome c [Magnetococcus sp. PR-3]|uniref:NapC/NirT family cytochrome c n=1 Tax=Magnetococcus sp. PR-3 TaxID=3120355 RepID=UPI002FCE014A